MPYLSVVIPVYNEEKSIRMVICEIKSVIKRLKNCTANILAIDDGSTDNTVEIARLEGVKVWSFGKHRGGFLTVIAAFLYMVRKNYDCLIKIDGDGQHDPSCIPLFLSIFERMKADYLIGSRFIGKKARLRKVKEKKFDYKFLGIKVSSVILSFLIKDRVTDATSGYRAFTRQACIKMMPYLKKYAKAFHETTFWIIHRILAEKLHLKVIELPVVMRERIHGVSKSFSLLSQIMYITYLIKSVLMFYILHLIERKRKEVRENFKSK